MICTRAAWDPAYRDRSPPVLRPKTPAPATAAGLLYLRVGAAALCSHSANLQKVMAMPTAPKRFRLSSQPTRTEQRKAYDERRGSATSRGYDNRWRKAARTFLQRHPLCLGCEAAGIVTEATLVDHVEPHRGEQGRFWNSDYWQSSCQWHHDVVKQRLELMWDRGQISTRDLWLNSSAALRLADHLR